MSSPRICIILVNWNGKNDTLECLASLANVEYNKFSTIVVDNGSSDGSVAAIRSSHPYIPIFETGENLGFAGGNNVGIEWALSKPFEWILLLNNDTIVDPFFLKAFVQEAEKNPKAKILGGQLLRYQDRQRLDHLGGKWNPGTVEFELIGHGKLESEYTQESQAVDYVCGAALFMHRSVPETIGLLEPKFFLFWEETDFCFRARRKGFEVWTAPQAKVWHKVSASFTGGKPHTDYFWWRSRLLWVERNIPYLEKKELMRKVIRPEMRKQLRHYLLKLLRKTFRHLFFLPVDPGLEQKTKRLKAGLAGILDYYRKKFGNCPSWIIKK